MVNESFKFLLLSAPCRWWLYGGRFPAPILQFSPIRMLDCVSVGPFPFGHVNMAQTVSSPRPRHIPRCLECRDAGRRCVASQFVEFVYGLFVSRISGRVGLNVEHVHDVLLVLAFVFPLVEILLQFHHGQTLPIFLQFLILILVLKLT